MQWLFVRLLIECLSGMTVLQVFFACHSLADVITILQTISPAGQLGVAVACTLLVSGPIELILAIIRLFRRNGRDRVQRHRG
jgi:hypothetical protein